MQRIALSFLIIVGSLCIGGCDAKKQQDQAIAEDLAVAEQLLNDATELRNEFDAQTKEKFDSGEAASTDAENVDKIANLIDQATVNSSPEQGQELLDLTDQVETLRQIQTLATPYQTALAEFTELGGLDATTINEPEQFGPRLELVESLIALNDKMDQELPALIRKLDQNPDQAQVDRKIGIIGLIRQADRDMYASMKGYLLVLEQLWDQYGIDEDGSIMFSPDVSPELIEEFNALADNIQKMTVEQTRLQRALVELDGP